jgi:hypothetical protein
MACAGCSAWRRDRINELRKLQREAIAMSIGDWEPFWLGSGARRLYAALHEVPGAPSTGVVVVPPLLHEAPRSRRFIAEVCNELADMGLPALRFDFHGTGDSTGSGDEVDFASMHRDLDLAVAALRERTGVRRVVLLAWRGGAFALRGWLDRGGVADLAVLWEPIEDGASWLQELVECDAGERAQRPPPRAGIPRITDPADGQLMGFPAPPQLRVDLAKARLDGGAEGGGVPVWAVVREGRAPSMEFAKVLPLPANAPSFNGGAAMDATFFLTPSTRELVGELAHAMGRGAGA